MKVPTYARMRWLIREAPVRGFRIRVGLPVLLVLATIVVPLHRLQVLVLAGHRAVGSDRGAPPVKGLLSTLLSQRVPRTGPPARSTPPRTRHRPVARGQALLGLSIHRIGFEMPAGPVFPLRC